MNGPALDALFEGLANGLWRGSLLVVVAAVLLRLLKKTTAAERYAAWLAVLTVIALAPVTVALLSRPRPAAPPMEIVLTSASAIDSGFLVPDQAPAEAPRRRQALAVSARPFLWLWSVVGLALVLRLWRRCVLAARLKRAALAPDVGLAAVLEPWERGLSATRMGSTRVTESLRSPAAVGWLEPAVLLPKQAHESADSADLEMLWRHEQAHIARRDDWTQLFCECLFALAWFHPAAHWVRRRLEKERELACDETVVNSGVEAGRYAGALGRWAERAATNELPVGVIGLGRSSALIIRRIEMLLSPSRIRRRNGGRWAFTGSLAAALGASFLLALSGPLVIRAQSVEEPVTVDVEVDVDVAVEPEVEIAVPVEALEQQVSVAPLLVSQAAPPAPPVPPAPRALAAPTPAPAPPVPPASQALPAPPPPPAFAQEREDRAKAMADRSKRWREEMRPQIEAIQEAASRMREQIRAQVGPQQEKLQALAKAMAEEHVKSIKPLAEQMSKLGAQIAAATDAQREELAAQMEALSKQMAAKEPEFRRLEEEISKIEIDMRPFEEQMKKFQEDLQEKQREFREAERKFRESGQPTP